MARCPEGMVLPGWLLAAKAALFPLEALFCKMGKNRGYQWDSDVWVIDGIRYSGAALHALAKSQGKVFRVSSEDGVVTLEHVTDKKIITTS